MNKKPTALKKVRLEREPRELGNKIVINDPGEVQKYLRSLFEEDEEIERQNQQFDKDRADEVEIYSKMIIEAKTPIDLIKVRSLILNRIIFLDKFPELKTVRKELKDLLESCNSEIEEMKLLNEISGNEPPKAIKSRGLKLAEIALICVYTRQHIDSTNAKDILNKFNPTLKTESRLIEKYNIFQQQKNRTGKYESYRTAKYIERLIIFVISYLETNNIETDKAKDDLKIISKEIEKYR